MAPPSILFYFNFNAVLYNISIDDFNYKSYESYVKLFNISCAY